MNFETKRSNTPEPRCRDNNLSSLLQTTIKPLSKFVTNFEGSQAKHALPLGLSDIGAHYIKPVPPTYVTEYESAYIKPPPMAYHHTIYRSRHDPNIVATPRKSENSYSPTTIGQDGLSLNSAYLNGKSQGKSNSRPTKISPPKLTVDVAMETHDEGYASIYDSYADMEHILKELLVLGYEEKFISVLLPIVSEIISTSNIDENMSLPIDKIDDNIEYLYEHIQLRILSNQATTSSFHIDSNAEKILHLCSAFVDTVETIHQLLYNKRK